VRSSARNQSNLSRREVKKRVREAKGLQQPQPYVEAPAAASTDRDFELTSNATFDQGWAVSWDEGRDPHPGYPEPVRVTWGTDPFANRDAAPEHKPIAPAPAAPPAAPVPTAAVPPAEPARPAPAPPPFAPMVAASPEPVAAAAPAPDPEPLRPPDLPRLQQAELARGHAPVRPGGLPSVRPPIKPAGADAARTRPPLSAHPLATQKLNRPQPQPDSGAAATPSSAPPSPGRLRRNENEDKGTEMLGWLDDLLGTEKGQSSSRGPSGPQS
jgi:hypothetical protein